MSLIQADNLTFYYEGNFDYVFEEVFFQIDTNWKLGLIGRNGKGKTTLLKLLKGELEYRGNITTNIAFDYFPYEIFNKEKETMEIIEQISPTFELWKTCRELTLLEMDAEVLYRPFHTLSNGEQTKVMLAVLFSTDDRFLLIDEPTNHLDYGGRQLVMSYLNTKKGFILVSHDRHFLDGCADHIMAINKAEVEVVKGNFSSWWENKKKRDQHEQAENKRLKKDVKRLEQASQQAKQWAEQVESTKIGHQHSKVEKNIDSRAYVGEKSRRMQQRRKNLERRQEQEVQEKRELLQNIEKTEGLKLFPKSHHKKELVMLEEVAIYYDEKVVVEHLNLIISQQKRIALQGKNGCGKSSIIKLILQEQKVCTKGLHVRGTIKIASGLVISYVPQDTSQLQGRLRDFIATNTLEESLFLTMLRKLDVSSTQFHKPMETYSQGQKKKILLAKSLCERAHLYIWDEPLNYIDLFSRLQLMELIKEYQPTMLFVEHDQWFLEEVATEIVTLI